MTINAHFLNKLLFLHSRKADFDKKRKLDVCIMFYFILLLKEYITEKKNSGIK